MLVATLRIFIIFILPLGWLSSCGQVGLSVDAEPFLYYAGNFFGGSDRVPTFTATDAVSNAFDVSFFRKDREDWVRYRFGLKYSLAHRDFEVELLDNQLNGTGKIASERIGASELNLVIGVEQERRKGAHQIKGLFGKGLSLSTSRKNKQRDIVNPLEAYLTDTLWHDSRHSLGVSMYLYTGLLYEVADGFVVSARISYGLASTYKPQEQLRVVQQENTGAEIVQYNASPSQFDWSIDFILRPRFTFSYYFR